MVVSDKIWKMKLLLMTGLRNEDRGSQSKCYAPHPEATRSGVNSYGLGGPYLSRSKKNLGGLFCRAKIPPIAEIRTAAYLFDSFQNHSVVVFSKGATTQCELPIYV